VENNIRDGVELPRPRALAEGREIAAMCAARLGLSTPILIDGMENEADRAYNAWPERLYVVARDGSIAYKGGNGVTHFQCPATSRGGPRSVQPHRVMKRPCTRATPRPAGLKAIVGSTAKGEARTMLSAFRRSGVQADERRTSSD
jgi:hypothetical protein